MKIFTPALKSPEEAFKLIEVELGILHDVSYTKREFLSTPWGVVLRIISCVSSLIALIAFMLVMGFGRDEESLTDMCISYFLLIGAVGLDINSVIVHCFSNWGIMRVSRETSWMTGCLGGIVVAWLSRREYGFNSMAQFNLIDFCRVSRASSAGAIEKFLYPNFILRKYWHTKSQHVNSDLKNLIYFHLKGKYEKYQEENYNRRVLLKILDMRGDDALKQAGMYEDFKWSTEIEFNNSLILWHVATSICYNDDFNKYDVGILGNNCKLSKGLSDYMLYLQVVFPNMLPRDIEGDPFKDTCDEVTGFIQDPKEFDRCDVSKMFLINNPDRPIIRIPRETKEKMLEASLLAGQLQNLVLYERWDMKDKWKLICEVWVEMLTYAASRCTWKEHIQGLQSGRELLSYVSLLMANMGLTDKVQIIELPEDFIMFACLPPWNWDLLKPETI